jgi:hypothetical protein
VGRPVPVIDSASVRWILTCLNGYLPIMGRLVNIRNGYR